VYRNSKSDERSLLRIKLRVPHTDYMLLVTDIDVDALLNKDNILLHAVFPPLHCV